MKTVSPHEAVAALRAGNVALVPTETVVGLVAAEPGLPRIREIKGRDVNKPIALLCISAEENEGPVKPRRWSTFQEATCDSYVLLVSYPHRAWPGSQPNKGGARFRP